MSLTVCNFEEYVRNKSIWQSEDAQSKGMVNTSAEWECDTISDWEDCKVSIGEQ